MEVQVESTGFAIVTATNWMAAIIGPRRALAGALLDRSIDIVATDPTHPITTVTASTKHAATSKQSPPSTASPTPWRTCCSRPA